MKINKNYMKINKKLYENYRNIMKINKKLYEN